MNLRKRWLAIAMTLFMTASLAPTGVFAASGGSSSGTAATAETQSAISAETYSELGLSRDVSGEDLMNEQQPYGKAEAGSTVATNVINELYVNFNGSIHYGWSILDDIPMKYRNGDAVENWTHDSNSYGAMGYWRPNQNTVKFKNGAKDVGALYADGSDNYNEPKKENMKILGDNINSSNYHLTNQYNLAEAFSPGTGKDNYVAQLRVNYNNDVYLEIYKVSKKSGSEKYDNTRVASKYIGNNDKYGGTREKTRIWNFEYDAMYDLAAGDMDGDGYDEIAVYFGNKIYLYTYKKNEQEKLVLSEPIINETVKPDVQNEPTSKDDANKLASAIVKFAFGDFDADGKEELAAAQSMTYGAKNQADAKVEILKFENNTLTSDSSSISLSNPDASDQNQKLIRYANVAAGDIDNDNIDELVIAGYSTNVMSGYNTHTCQKSNILYKVVECSAKEGLGNTESATGWKATKFEKSDILGRIADNTGQLVTPVSLACAATQGVGYAEQIFMSGCLYSFDTSGKEVKLLTQMTTNREYKKDDGGKNNKSEIYVLNTVTGNFNGNEYGQEQIICVFAMKSDNSDNHWFDIAYINKDQPGDTDAEGTKGYWYGQEQVMNQECSYNFTSEKTRASLYLSLAAVDCDDDSTLMKYKGKSVSYTTPEVYTVLQSAPYFEDLEENRGYLNQSETSYGTSSASGSTVTTGGSLSAGMYMSYEQDISVFGVKIASVEAEVQYKHSFSYDFEYEETVTESISYSASAGDDYAVVYTVPYMDYQYEVWVPESDVPENDNEWKEFLKKSYDGWDNLDGTEQSKIIAESKAALKGKTKIGGYWDNCTISIPMTPKTVILTVDTYDDVASNTAGMQTIRGNILNSTPGNPETYINYSDYSGKFNAIGKEQMVTNAEGSYISISGEKETVQTHNFAYDFEMEGKVGAGAGGLTVGALAGFGFSVGGGFSNSNSKSYSCIVDNLPADATNYTFYWQFGTRTEKLNGNNVLILEYRTRGVSCPPSPPKNIHIESVSTDSVSLKWDAVPGATNYMIYQVNSGTGTQLLMKTLPGSATSYVDDQVSPNTSYTYCIRTLKGGVSSILSKEVTATTLSSGMENFSIIEQPKNASTFASGNATFSIAAQCLNNNGQPYTLHYQWQRYDDESRSWIECDPGANGSSTYTCTNVQPKDDGTQYRCLVYVNINLLLYSTPAEIKIGKASSSTALSAAIGSSPLADNSNVKTSYVKSENVTLEDQTVEVPITTSDGYTLYSCKDEDGNTETLYYKDNCYYLKNKNGSLDQMSVKYEKESISFMESENQLKTVDWNSLTKDSSYTADSKSFYMDAEGKIVELNASGAQEYKASEKYDFTDNGSVISFYKCSVSETDGESTLQYDLWFAVKDSKDHTADLQENIYLTPDMDNIVNTESKKFYITDLEVQTKSENVTQTVETTVEGDTVTFTADVGSEQKAETSGYVTFVISSSDGTNTRSERAAIGSDGSTAVYNWTPTTSGVYTITATYEGNDLFKASSSKSMTLNVVKPYEKKLVLSGSNMTYGDDAQHISLMLLDGKETGDVESMLVAPDNGGVSAKYVDGNTVSDAASGVVSISSDGKTILFNPDKAGTYSITVKYTDSSQAVGEYNGELTVTKSIKVYKRDVVVTPDDIETQLGVKKDLTYKIEGIVSGDEDLFKNKITLSCTDNGTDVSDANQKGSFTITASVASDTAITEKYNVTVRTGTLNVLEDAYAVYNYTDDANGTVKLSYSVNGVGIEVQSGSLVPKGAVLTATAKPAEGYAVKTWYKAVVDSGNIGSYEPVYIGSGTAQLNTSNTLIISDSLDKSYSVKAEFELVYYDLEFGIDEGTVTAEYVGASGTKGEIFSSGSRLNPMQKVQLTAKPAEGRTIKEWHVYNDASDKTKYNVIKADNGSNNYTGDTYTVSGISADTKVEVITEGVAAANISVAFEDTEGNALTSDNMGVSFNGTAADGTDGVFTYSGNNHDNVTIKLSLPESLIVESWNDVTITENSKNYNVITSGLKDQKKTYIISDLSKDRNIVVKCVAPNSYKMTASTTLFGKDSETGGTVKVYKSGSSDALVSGSSVLQASVLRIVATPNDGYDAEQIYVNGLPVVTVDANDGKGSKSYTINGISGDTVVKADFSKRPVITLNADGLNGAADSVTAKAGGDTVSTLSSAGTVAYKSKNDIVITAVAPDGYEVTGFTVGSSSEEGTPNDSDNNRTYTVSAGENGITGDVTVTAKFRKLDTYDITYSIIDTNGAEDGGFNGNISLSASRKGYTDSIVTGNAVLGGDIKFTIYEGSNVKLTIIPEEGYRLQHLTVDGVNRKNEVSGNIYTFENLAASHEVQAQFETVGNKIYFSAENSEDSKGSISAVYRTSEDSEEKEFENGSSLYAGSITFTAKPDDGYRIAGWYIDNVLQKDESGETITGSKFVYAPDTEDTGADIVVKFERSHYNVTFDIANDGGTAEDPLWGTVSVSGNAVENGGTAEAVNGDDFTFTVTPDDEHMIEYVKIDGTEFTNAAKSLETAEITIKSVKAAKSVEVRFAEIPEYTVTVGVEGKGKVICGTDEISGNAVKLIDVKYGDSITLKAEADEHNTLFGWKQTGSEGYVSKADSYKLKPSSDITLTAVFGEESAYSVGYEVPDPNIGKLTMTIGNTHYTGKEVDGKCENNNVASGQQITFEAIIKDKSKYCVYDWFINKKSVCGYGIGVLSGYSLQNGGAAGVVSYAADNSDDSVRSVGGIEYKITDNGTKLTILSLEKNVEVSVEFADAADYEIKVVSGAELTDASGIEVTKVPRWGSANITVGKDHSFNKDKLKEAVGSNAEYSVVNNSDGSVTVKLSNIIGEIDTTSAFTKKPENAGGGGGGGGGGAVASNEYTVKFDTGWFVKPADQKVAQGKKVTEPKLEDHGNYTLEGWYSDAQYSKRYSFDSAVKSDMTLYAKWKLKSDEHGCASFADIAEHWAKEYICFAVESGLMNGVSKEEFAPDSLLSRGMLVTVLYRADGSPEIDRTKQGAGFADVEDGKWYADAVEWASANGIVNGMTSADGLEKLFAPDDSITREQFAAIMYRYAQYKGCDVSNVGTDALDFEDYGEISQYARTAVEWAVSEGLITGVSDTKLAPKGSATRAQTAAILQRFAENIM